MNNLGEVDVDGIPEEHWDIAFADLILEKEVAEGTFGRVFRASYFGTPVAVKLLFQAETAVSNIGKYILRELSMLRAVTHPNIVQFLGLCKHNEHVFLVTEYLPHGDLMELICDPDRPVPSWSLRLHLLQEIAKPVAYLHARNIVHRDLKLENVLVGDGWTIKLCDFGFARVLENQETNVRGVRTRKMTVAGTDQWMAPEVLMQQPYNEQADIFSLGCIFYEVLCRRQPPFRTVATKYAFDVQEFLTAVPKTSSKELVLLTLDLCQFNPAKRPTSKEVLQQLQQLKQMLPPVDFSEFSSLVSPPTHAAAPLSPVTASAAIPIPPADDNRLPRASEGESSDPAVDESLNASGNNTPGADGKDAAYFQFLRAFSDGDMITSMESSSPKASSPKNGNNNSSGGRPSLQSLHLRYETMMHKKVGNVLAASWVYFSNLAQMNPARKLFVALTSDGSLYFWKSEKSSELSCLHVLLDEASTVSRAETPEKLRISSPVRGGSVLLMDFKSASTAEKWYNALLGAIMRSDFNYMARIKSGAKFGWSPATRDANGAVLKSCFAVEMMAPEQRSVIVAVAPSIIRILLPYTEEIVYEWRFARTDSYSLDPSGRVTINVSEEPGLFSSGARMFGRSRNQTKQYVFATAEHSQLYDALEVCWAKAKEDMEKLYQESVSQNLKNNSNNSNATGPSSKLRAGKRLSLVLSRPVVSTPPQDTQQEPAASSSTTNSRRGSRAKSPAVSSDDIPSVSRYRSTSLRKHSNSELNLFSKKK